MGKGATNYKGKKYNEGALVKSSSYLAFASWWLFL